jgi:cholesterol oxidase
LSVRKLLTAHPLGGCTLSMSPHTGVVNEYGEVWEYPNLYVADGSIIPTALAVNPSNTIGALAERIAFRIIHGREMQVNDPKLPKNA